METYQEMYKMLNSKFMFEKNNLLSPSPQMWNAFREMFTEKLSTSSLILINPATYNISSPLHNH